MTTVVNRLSLFYSLWLWEVSSFSSNENCDTLAHMAHRTISVGKQSLHYITYGDPKNPPLVLLHGFHAVAESISTLAEFMSDSFYVLSFDLPGFGKSDACEDGFSILNCASVIDKALRRLELTNYALAGISLGGAIASEMARVSPKNCRVLVLVQPLYTGTCLMIPPWRRYSLNALLNFCKIPLISKTFLPFVMHSDRLLLSLMRLMGMKKLDDKKECAGRLANMRVCSPYTYILGLLEILNYVPSEREKICTIPGVLLLHMEDDVLNSKATKEGYDQMFCNLQTISIHLDNHNPIEKPTKQQIQHNFPTLSTQLSRLARLCKNQKK